MCSFEVQKYRNMLRRKTVNEKCTYDFNHGKVLWFWLKLNLWIQQSLEILINLYLDDSSNNKLDTFQRRKLIETRRMSSKSILADLWKD